MGNRAPMSVRESPGVVGATPGDAVTKGVERAGDIIGMLGEGGEKLLPSKPLDGPGGDMVTGLVKKGRKGANTSSGTVCQGRPS